MVKLYTHTEEIEHCGECPHPLSPLETLREAWVCGETGRTTKRLWGKIPSWCPLPEKKE